MIIFKQFVVMNCSKERPGSMVTKTQKNGILIPIATSKESHFNADFKYISFIKFSLTYQKLKENVEFCIFCQKADHGCVFICFFFSGVIISNQWS